MIFIKAFLGGGIVCVIGHFLLTKLKISISALLTGFVCLGGLLTALGIMPHLLEMGAGGVAVMVTSAGEAMFYGFSMALSGNMLPMILFWSVILFCIITGIIAGIIHHKMLSKTPVNTKN